MGKIDPRALLDPIARAQCGPFTYRQAREAGFSKSAIGRRLKTGSWLPLHRGVMCDRAVPASLQREVSAAVLACGSTAAASLRSAARLWEVEVPFAERPDVVVLGPARPRPAGVSVHRTTRLGRSEAAALGGIRVTSPMRTLLDVGALVEPRLLELALDRLWRRGLIEPRRLVVYLADEWCARKRGSAALRRLAAERCGQGPSGSDIETLLLQLIREANLPLPVRQHPVVTPFGVRYLDLAYVREKIAIELDGMDSRLDIRVFLDERVRQNLIEAQGWTFRRFGYAHVTKDAVWTVFTLGEALGLRPIRWTGRG
jgi:very-short-patch-repair endonuclease